MLDNISTGSANLEHSRLPSTSSAVLGSSKFTHLSAPAVQFLCYVAGACMPLEDDTSSRAHDEQSQEYNTSSSMSSNVDGSECWISLETLTAVFSVIPPISLSVHHLPTKDTDASSNSLNSPRYTATTEAEHPFDCMHQPAVGMITMIDGVSTHVPPVHPFRAYLPTSLCGSPSALSTETELSMGDEVCPADFV